MTNRPAILEEEIRRDQDAFLRDIELWTEQPFDDGDPVNPKDDPIKHHIEQFLIMAKKAVDSLNRQYASRREFSKGEKQFEYRSFVTGTLSAQWLLIRELAQQRVKHSPYRKDLAELDNTVTESYFRLVDALPDQAKERVSKSAPLTYLGDVTGITLVSTHAPSIIDLAIGTRKSDQSELAIAHEIGHYLFDQLSIVAEARAKLMVMPSPASNAGDAGRRRIIRKIVLTWLDEIFADLAGTALEGESFIESAVKLMIMPEEAIGITDEGHPVPVVRPYAHLVLLKRLAGNAPVSPALTQSLGELNEPFLDKRFESSPHLAVISLRDVQEEMQEIVNQLLDMKYDSLGGDSLWSVLEKCFAGRETFHLGDRELPKWGETIETPFVLEIDSPLPTVHALPVSHPLWVCCKLGLQRCCRGGLRR